MIWQQTLRSLWNKRLYLFKNSFRLSNNKRRWWMRMVAAFPVDSQSKLVGLITGWQPRSTNGQRILTKGRIAILSPLTSANGFIQSRPYLGSDRVSLQTVSRWVQPSLHTPQQILLNAFQWGGGAVNPQNCPSPWWSEPYLIYGFLSPPSQCSKRHLDLFSRFAGHICMSNAHTHTHTDHATCDNCRNRPHLC